jgi:signal peptidase II
MPAPLPDSAVTRAPGWLRRRLSPKLLWLGLLTPTLFGFDWASKKAIVETVGPREVVPVLGSWLSLVHAENPGAGFSLPIPMAVLILAGFVGLGLLVRMVVRMPDAARLPAVAVSMLLAGGLGNQLDRLGDGTVTDFMRVSAVDSALGPWLIEQVGTATWPIFNVADVLLLVGVGMLVVMPRRWMESAPA